VIDPITPIAALAIGLNMIGFALIVHEWDVVDDPIELDEG
jgi:hypothetical protein